MKKYLLLLIIPFLFGGCKVGRTTESKGLENEAYLQFVQTSSQKYAEGVTVFVDNLDAFNATVNKVNDRTVKGNIYTIKSGPRHLKVVYKDKTLYEKDIVLSSQQTRQIQLP
jgi:hypothetical protein